MKKDARLENAAKLLSMVPTLEVPQALRAHNFSDDEAENPALQRRVRSLVGKMKSRQQSPSPPPPQPKLRAKTSNMMMGKPPSGRSSKTSNNVDPIIDPQIQKAIRSNLIRQRREKTRSETTTNRTIFNIDNACVGAVVDSIQGAGDYVSSKLEESSPVDAEEIDRMVRVCESLVGLNMGLWRGCCQRMKIVQAHTSFRKKIKKSLNITFDNKGLKKGECVFQREAYSRVTAKTSTEDPTLFIMAVPERGEKVFKFPQISMMLHAMVQTPIRDDCFIDYEEYLERALSLHDHVLLVLLAQLKVHLEEVQVWLGELDNWVSYSDICVSRLEALFNKKLPCLRNKKIGGNGPIVMRKFPCFNCKIELKINLKEERDIVKLQKFLEFSTFLEINPEERKPKSAFPRTAIEI